MYNSDEVEQQHIDDVYAQAQEVGAGLRRSERPGGCIHWCIRWQPPACAHPAAAAGLPAQGLYDRDKETRSMLEGTPVDGSPAAAQSTSRGLARPSAGGLARPSVQSMQRQGSGADISEGTSGEGEDMLQTARPEGGCCG